MGSFHVLVLARMWCFVALVFCLYLTLGSDYTTLSALQAIIHDGIRVAMWCLGHDVYVYDVLMRSVLDFLDCCRIV